VGRASESISESVFGAGRRSALIVLLRPGKAARADPVEGSGAPLQQNRSWATRRCFETCKRANETGANSRAGAQHCGDGCESCSPEESRMARWRRRIGPIYSLSPLRYSVSESVAVRNRMRQLRTSGSVRGEGGNVLAYSADRCALRLRRSAPAQGERLGKRTYDSAAAERDRCARSVT
jgi:hypothetical protein